MLILAVLRRYNLTLWFLVRIKEGVLGVKVYGSRHPCQRELGTLGWRRSENGENQVKCTSLGGREMEEVRQLESGGIRD
jgi:hypothetical protein